MKVKSFIIAALLSAVSVQTLSAARAQDSSELVLSAEVSAAPAITSPSLITLDQAINRALEKSPLLGASTARMGAAAANRSQAGALPNPTISAEIEDMYGDYNGIDSAEITYGISQLIELPGKRGNRVRVADAEKDKIHFVRDITQLDLIRDVTIAYAEAVAAQQDVKILEEEYTLATEVRDSVAAKVDAGKEPPIQKNKAEIERSASQIALERARRNLITKQEALFALMGDKIGNFSVAADALPPLAAPEPLETYRSRLIETPDIKGFEAQIAQAQAGLSLEKANALPDPTFNFGVKNIRQDDTQALVAGVSLPLPVFNMNRAGIDRAGYDLKATVLDKQASELSREAAMVSLYGDFISAYNEYTTLNSTILPGAEEAFHFAREGYDAGKFGYLEVLDAQRTLFDARKQVNTALLDYYRLRASLERMTTIHPDNDTDAHKEKTNAKIN